MITDLKQHLTERFVNFDVHHPFIDEQECKATFLLYNLSGKIVGKQQYNPNEGKSKSNDVYGRYITIRTEFQNTQTVFGLEAFNWHTTKTIFVTEGIFDATRITWFKDECCISLLGNSTNPREGYKSWLKSLGRKTVAVCDSDKAGLQLAKLTDCAIILDPKHGKDLGECSIDVVRNVINVGHKLSSNERNKV